MSTTELSTFLLRHPGLSLVYFSGQEPGLMLTSGWRIIRYEKEMKFGRLIFDVLSPPFSDPTDCMDWADSYLHPTTYRPTSKALIGETYPNP